MRQLKNTTQVSPQYPDVINVEVSSVCNLRCTMCLLTKRNRGVSGGHMVPETWRRVCEFAPLANKINVSGFGEIFSNPRLIEMLFDLDYCEVPFAIVTNGTLLTERSIKDLSGLRNLYQVSLSIDSPNPKIYKKIRGIELSDVLKNLNELTRNLPGRVTVSSVVMDDNIESLLDFPELLAKYNVGSFYLQGLINFDRLGKSTYADNELLNQCIEKIQVACSSRNISLQVFPYLQCLISRDDTNIWGNIPKALCDAGRENKTEKPDTNQCLAPWDHISIDKDGNILPCCFAAMHLAINTHDVTRVMGNINKQDFCDIWKSETFRTIRQKLLTGPPPACCRTCFVTSKGVHFFNLFKAEIVFEKSSITGDNVVLKVRNTGLAAWDINAGISVGTSKPRDRQSSLYHSTWLSPHRVTRIDQRVEPNEEVTLRFKICQKNIDSNAPEKFQLLTEGICWLVDTGFEIN